DISVLHEKEDRDMRRYRYNQYLLVEGNAGKEKKPGDRYELYNLWSAKRMDPREKKRGTIKVHPRACEWQ
ncbi:MAG: hypothetical protein ACRD4Q_09465, partial [Candidatus Acidiferrales bacterium]